MSPSFRTKLFLSMILLVLGVSAPILVITQNQVRDSYERYFQQSFELQNEAFFQQREARLSPVREQMRGIASGPRIVAAMDNANHSGATQEDVDDVYRNGLDQVTELLKTYGRQGASLGQGFFFFLNTRGEVLFPSSLVGISFKLPRLQQIAAQLEKICLAAIRNDAQQIGYLAPPDADGVLQLSEMVFTPLVDPVTHDKLGILAAGFPLLETGNVRRAEPRRQAGNSSPGLNGVWIDAQLYSPNIDPDFLPVLVGRLSRELTGGLQRSTRFVLQLGGTEFQVFCQALRAGPAFPAAYQVSLYSLAEAQREKKILGQRILLSSVGALAVAFLLSLIVSRGLTVPLRELVAGVGRIQGGNYNVKVRVHRRDELGQLAVAFNDMTERVEAAHLAQEDRIRERTAELLERKRAEEALRESEASLREAQRIAHLGSWRWDLASGRWQGSAEIFSIVGMDHVTNDLTADWFLDRVHPDDRAKVEATFEKAVQTRERCNLEHRIVGPKGESRIVQERAEVLPDSAGHPLALVGTLQDVTEQKRIEAEFLRAQRLDGIGALASGIAHDLNNSLSPILMGIQLIRRQVRDPDALKMLSVMETNTHRGADMVRQVLTFARGRDGERELLNLGRVVREMEAIGRQTLPKSMHVSAMVPDDLWPVRGNSTQLHQVLLNLCINSRDAMPDGGEITLAADNVHLQAEEAKTIPNATPGDYVMLLVSDTGTGIPAEALPRIFEPFFTTKSPGKGTGLGLSTIARIVRSHEGFVQVRSELGAGTTFEIYLPRAEVATPQPASQSLPPSRTEADAILLVDDDRSMREMAGPALNEQGFRVLSAANGSEALTLFQSHEGNVRLLLTDWAMPVMNGEALIKAVRLRKPDLPIIIMTGDIEAVDASQPGVTGILVKPFRLEELLAEVAKTVPRSPIPASKAGL